MYKLKRENPDVWLLPELKLGYVQIPKVATRSIRQCLAATLGMADVEMAAQKYSRHIAKKELASLSYSFNFFAFTRDPLDRLYSCYKNKVEALRYAKKDNIFEVYGVKNNTSFDRFVEIIAGVPDHQADRHFRSQIWFLTDNQNRLFVQNIYRLEHFREGWQDLQQSYRLFDAPHENKSRCKLNINQAYSEKTLKTAMKRYEADIDFLTGR
jgi:dermatan 4-sulfotransferase 1